MTYLTKSGIKVWSAGQRWFGEVLKVECYRVGTGGFHGWLRRDRLKPYRKPKVRR